MKLYVLVLIVGELGGGGGGGAALAVTLNCIASDVMSCVLTSSENQEYKTKKINCCYQ